MRTLFLNRQPPPRRAARSRNRSWSAAVAVSALACLLFAGPMRSEAEEEGFSKTPEREQLTVEPEPHIIRCTNLPMSANRCLPAPTAAVASTSLTTINLLLINI